jgi:hypothetical protein
LAAKSLWFLASIITVAGSKSGRRRWSFLDALCSGLRFG